MTRLGVPLGLLLVVLLAHADVAFLGRSFQTSRYIAGTVPAGPWGYPGQDPPGDYPFMDMAAPALEHYPLTRAARRQWVSGTLPLWNPDSGCGQPLAANMQVEAFSPLKLPMWVLGDTPLAWDLYTLGRLWLAACGAWVFARRWGAGRVGAPCAGALYALSGHLILQANMPYLGAAALFPWLLAAADALARRPAGTSLGLAAVATAALVLAGFPQSTFLLCLAATLFVAVHPSARPRLRLLAGWLGASALGFALAGPQLLPFLEYWAHAQHEHPPERGAGLFAHPPEHALLLLSPFSLGPIHKTWVPVNWHMQPGPLGLGTTALGLAALLDRGSRRRRGILAGAAAAACLAKFYGLPGLNEIVGSLPLLARCHIARYGPPVLGLAAAVLAGTTVQNAWRGRLEPRVLSRGLLAASAALLVLLWWHAPTLDAADRLEEAAQAALPAAAAAAALAALAGAGARLPRQALAAGLALAAAGELAALVPHGRPLRHDPFTTPPFVRTLREAMAERPGRLLGLDHVLHSATPAGHGLPEAGAHDAMHVRRAFGVLHALLGSRPEPNPTGGEVRSLDHPFWNVLGLRYVAARRETLPHLREGLRADPTPGNVPVGPLEAGRSVGQTFLSPEDRLCGVRLLLGTYRRENPGTLVLRLFDPDSPAPLREARRPAPGIENDRWNDVFFDPLPGSSGRRLRFEVGVEGGDPQRAPTIWMNPGDRHAGGNRTEAGHDEPGDLGFATLHAPAWEDGPEFRPLDALGGGPFRLYENRRAFPRAFAVHRWIVVADAQAARARVLAASEDLRRVAILEASPPLLPPEAEPPSPSVVRVESDAPDEVALRATMAADGLLVLADTWFPGWGATVDGSPAPVLPANAMLRAVPVPSGEHRVVLRYAPGSFRAGLALSAAALAVLLAAALARRRGTA
ncbi:MAG: YfhO family protein [Planctomycetales bacterium]|nr:YfhO family protein [Planctomycetales bacterium]